MPTATSVTDAQAHVDSDGVVRLVLFYQDPGVQKWLDTSGLREGTCSAARRRGAERRFCQ